jgi:hypothetical protein
MNASICVSPTADQIQSVGTLPDISVDFCSITGRNLIRTHPRLIVSKVSSCRLDAPAYRKHSESEAMVSCGTNSKNPKCAKCGTEMWLHELHRMRPVTTDAPLNVRLATAR